MLHSAEKGNQGEHGKTQSQPGYIHAKEGGQAAADTAKALVLQVPEEFFLSLGRLVFRLGVFGLDAFRPANHLDNSPDVRGRHHAAPAALSQKFRDALFDSVHDFPAAFLGEVVVFQVPDISAQDLGRFLFQGEGISANAVLFCLRHGYLFFKVSMLWTISCQAASISSSWLRPFSVIT